MASVAVRRTTGLGLGLGLGGVPDLVEEATVALVRVLDVFVDVLACAVVVVVVVTVVVVVVVVELDALEPPPLAPPPPWGLLWPWCEAAIVAVPSDQAAPAPTSAPLAAIPSATVRTATTRR